MVDFKLLETFVWVVTLGSFRGAAEKLNTTQPAISQRIAQLENELGIKLLERNNHSTLPTHSGRQMMHFAEKLLETRSAMLSALRGSLRAERRSSSRGRGNDRSHLADALYREIEQRVSKPFAGNRGRHYDQPAYAPACSGNRSGLCGRPLAVSTVRNRILCDYPVAFLASPSVGLGGRLLTVHDLAKFPIITFPRKTQPYELVRSLFNKPDVPPIKLHASASLATVIHMATEGLGIAVIPTVIVKEQLKDGRLLLLNTDLQVPNLTFSASWLASPDTLAIEIAADIAATLAQE